MTLKTKRIVIAVLSATFLASLLLVQWMEVLRKREEAGLAPLHVVVQSESRDCVDCHAKETPGIAAQWRGSTHAVKGVGCVECHRAEQSEADAYEHYGATIATMVTPRDCRRCHPRETDEFCRSHHAAAGNILHSLDNFLAETVEGARMTFNPHSPTPGANVEMVNGMSFAFSGCHQCHGSKVALQSIDGGMITVDDLKPDENGKPTNEEILAKIRTDDQHKPLLHSGTWPNTGIGRLNLDGTRGSCSACHSRHDFSPRRARQPESCGKCHLGPDHPQKEIFDESKHGIAFVDLKAHMNLNAATWVLGRDYTQAPTCATCHLSGNLRNEGRVTHDPAERISWTNRPEISLRMDTDKEGNVVQETDSLKRKRLVVDTAQMKRQRMQQVCSHCHTPDYVNSFYKQYDDFVVLYNEKFGKPGQAIMAEIKKQKLLTPQPFDEELEWTWYYLWHHEGRRARHGASMMAPDYAHWHGTFEVAERFYQRLIPQVREIAHRARSEGKPSQAQAVESIVDEILRRPEHAWFQQQTKPPSP
jgi:hypothetical protein